MRLMDLLNEDETHTAVCVDLYVRCPSLSKTNDHQTLSYIQTEGILAAECKTLDLLNEASLTIPGVVWEVWSLLLSFLSSPKPKGGCFLWVEELLLKENESFK